ncbi:MAG: FtsW/RodA/SpoVE family cell cycle protein [Oscillospiraceae bacterium]|nr:FtsW/RodA/SpoVE family cell cycle protein [Oscillospiraceae bacterium]
MRRLGAKVLEVIKKSDLVLLTLCVVTSLYGIVMIYAASYAWGEPSRYIVIQLGCVLAGIVIYFILTAVDVQIIAGQRTILVLFNAGLMLLLLVWGEWINGNRSWLDIPFLPFNIQPAEVCKIFYVIILARTLSINQNRISSFRSVFSAAFHMAFMVGLVLVLSGDMGVSLIFIFIFLAMAYMGGVSNWWFLAGIGLIAVAAPTLWETAMDDYQKNRILALFNPELDPYGRGVLWQTNLSKEALSNGGLVGMGLLNGEQTNTLLPASHTDSIFSSIGEQLGLVGSLITLALLLSIVGRILYVGFKSPDYMNRLICIGMASVFLFQIIINVGVCLGLIPVIGLTLPFISYGGSSILTAFMAVGFVSGIKMRPAPDRSTQYIRPY